jgi:membrane protease YdiL (CAAX protease family)
MKKFWLRVEFLFLFVAIPLLINFDPHTFHPFLLLGLVLVYILFLNLRLKKIRKKKIFTFYHHHHLLLPDISKRIFASLAVMIVFIIFYDHYLMFNMIKKDPWSWLILIVLYPILSVVPQEIVYRSFFFARYKKIFAKYFLVFMSAASFSFAHIIFHNYIAVIFTFIGGLYFAISYQQTKSLLLVVVEHSIYGMFLYTIGFGEFFDFDAMNR